MSVTVHWDTPAKRQLVLTFVALWTWDEYDGISDDIERAFNSTGNTVDFFIDLRQAGDMPADVIRRLGDAYWDATSNLRGYVFIGASAHFKTMLTVADNYYPMLGGRLVYTFVETLEEARNVANETYVCS